MPELVSLDMIWDRAPHNAFTDLGRAAGRWYCVFREAGGHAGAAGKIRVLSSLDGKAWASAALLTERGIDLRDPKISRSPSGGLELIMGGTRMRSGKAIGRRPRIASSPDGLEWGIEPILEEGDWLWRTARYRGADYGISYRLSEPLRWTIHLFKGRSGSAWKELCEFGVPGRPNESTIRFARDGRAIALVRREAGSAWIGSSLPPWTSWSWKQAGERVGGPNFLILKDGSMWAATRIWRRGKARVALCTMTESSLTPILGLPSGGDCGYPGMVFHRSLLSLSYYSSHEGKAKIYLARVRL